ncbi:hypothetical protein [uncultured Tateyamaria sp.]|uniref:hypothetical protein n=1 Tax=Tateyamaria sp. 1078 TaxID=3417464 RepID=UPI0026089ADF|nr:hypothetical protein [uncultured Tateyamaria sp.]
MTTIITRLFDAHAAASHARERIIFCGVPSRAVTVIGPAEGNDARPLMEAAHVHPDAMDTYATAITSGKSLLVVRTTYRPLTAATMVRDMLAKMDTVDTGDVVDDYYMTDTPEKAPSILDEHPLFLTLRLDTSGYDGGRLSDALAMRMVSPRKERNSAKGRSGKRSSGFWPMPLVSRKDRGSSVMPGGRHMSGGFWPMGLLSRGNRSNSSIRGGDKPFSRALGWPTTS